MFGGEKGCRGIMWCLRRKWGALTCLGIKGVFGGRKGCPRHNGVFGVQMRCFGHGVKGVVGGRKGVLEAKRGVWGRKGVFGGCNGKCPGGTLLVPGVPFQE